MNFFFGALCGAHRSDELGREEHRQDRLNRSVVLDDFKGELVRVELGWLWGAVAGEAELHEYE